jgi:hypothetical protein
MLGLGWLKLWQAREALQAGRLDDAYRLVESPCMPHHRRRWDIHRQLAAAFAERAEKKLRQNDPTGAWADLLKAEQTGADDPTAAILRRELIEIGLAELLALLQAGEAARAVETVSQLRDRHAAPPELDALDEAAKAWVAAREQADKGEFPLAMETLERVQRLVPEAARAVERWLFAVHERQLRFHDLLPTLHEAGRKARWQEVVRLAEEVLAAAPQHAEAKSLRARAWKAIEPPTMIVGSRDRQEEPGPAEGKADKDAEPVVGGSQAFHLWIDGVGGFLVCLGNRVTLGQATPESTVDVPLMADVSRLHAALVRDSEGYLLHALRPVRVNGKVVEKTLLHSGDRLILGSCCQLQFLQPAPVSTSARLELSSGHRPRLAVDAVLLMADTLVLGPGQQVHVQMPDLVQPVILYRQKEGLGIRAVGTFTINGQSVRERGVLKPGDHVVSEQFSLTLEPVVGLVGRR